MGGQCEALGARGLVAPSSSDGGRGGGDGEADGGGGDGEAEGGGGRGGGGDGDADGGGGDGETDGGGLPEAVFQWPPNMQTFVSILKCLSKNSMNSLLTFTKKWAFLLLSKMSTSPSSLGRN